MPDKAKASRRNRPKTKDRVLQARIPEQLDEELRNRSEQLGLSVSTIVRNVLLNTFDLVEGVVSDSSGIARALKGWATSPSGPDTEAPVIGWQEAVLNRNGVCEQCNVILPLGQRAAIGVPTGARVCLLCLDCLGSLSSSNTDAAKPSEPKKERKRSPKSASSGLKKTAG